LQVYHHLELHFPLTIERHSFKIAYTMPWLIQSSASPPSPETILTRHYTQAISSDSTQSSWIS